LQEKAKLASENERLLRENCGLQVWLLACSAQVFWQLTEHWAILEQEAGSSSHARFSAAAATSSALLPSMPHTALCSAQELLQYTVQAGDSDCEEEDVSDGADWPPIA